MKKICLSIIAGMLSLSAFSETQTILTISGTDGSVQEFDIATIKNITFDSENEQMNINLANSTETLDIADIEDMYFAVFDGIESIYDVDLGNDLNVELHYGVLTATQPNSQLNMRIFDMSGKLIDTKTAYSELTYSLTGLPAGIYVITVNDKAIKFIR